MQYKNIDEYRVFVESPLSFDELWQAAGIPKSLAQNWTNDRPFRLEAYITQGKGKGSRSVYAVIDAYVLAFLYLLKNKGLSTRALATLVSVFNQDAYHRLHTLTDESGWAEITFSDERISVGPLFVRRRQRPNPTFESRELDDSEPFVGKMFVNTKRLRKKIDGKLQALRKRA